MPSYRQSYTKVNHHWKPEGNPRFTVTHKWRGMNFQFSNRNRLEYRSRSHLLLYRNQSLIEFSTLLSCEITPYISEEFFLEKLTDFSQNHLLVGFKSSLNKCLQGNVGYMFRLSKDTRDWFGYHVLLCYLDLKF